MTKYISVGYGKKRTLTKPYPPFTVKKEVSIILPTYNEEKNIANLVDALQKEFSKVSYEILILDDSSKDATPTIIDTLAKQEGIVAIHRSGKKGYFSAYQDAIAMAHGTYILTMDSDNSHPPAIARALYDHKDTADIISGSRYMREGTMKAPFLRKYGSLLLNKICAMIIGLRQTDISGDFHIMKREDFLKLPFKYTPIFGEFDFELLYRAKMQKLTVKEIPFVYDFRQNGESAMGSGAQDSLKLASFAWAYIKMALRLRFKG